MEDVGGKYARLCAWATRIGCSDEHVVGFARRVCDSGFLEDRDRWPEILVQFFVDEQARTGKTIVLNELNVEMQERMVVTTDQFRELYRNSDKVKITTLEKKRE